MTVGNSEFTLSGGRITPGVVRVGDTVRRPRQPNAELAHALLVHLAAVGFAGAPRFLGIDERGRDILSYIEGEVPADLGWHGDATLVAGARLVREFHDATVELVPQSAAAAGAEVICHNDLSPCNFVFRGGTPIAMIDFDTAAPGTRTSDVGYAVWGWLDLGNEEIEAAEQRRRLGLFVAAYDERWMAASIKEAIIDRQHRLAADGDRTGKPDMANWARACRAWTERNL